MPEAATLSTAPNVSASAKPKNESLVWVDALRGLAALQIVLYHVRVDLWVGFREVRGNPELYNWFERAVALVSLPFSFSAGVMIFFVISGFCVHLPEASSSAPLNLKSYACRRFFRIYPPYIAAIALTALVEAWLYLRGWTPALNVRIWAEAAAMAHNYFGHGQWRANPSLWSLPVEMELYLVYPLFLLFSRRCGMAKSFFSVAAISILAAALGANWTLLAGNFLIYWPIWCAGAALAQAYRNGTLPRWNWYCWIGVAGAALLAMAAARQNWNHTLQNYGWGTVGFALLWWSLQKPRSLEPANRALRFVAGVGVISYSLYLIHFPFFRVAGQLWMDVFGAKPGNFLVPIFFVAVSLLVARLFYRLIEQPSHRLARDMAAKFAPPRNA